MLNIELTKGEYLARLIHQYKDSPNLIALIRARLDIIGEIFARAEEFDRAFSIDHATGYLLTLWGKLLGFPREHRVRATQPVFGFPNPASHLTIVGFDEPNSVWLGAETFQSETVTIEDDELYRRLLRVRTYQIDHLYDIESLEACAKILWGDQAFVPLSAVNRVTLAPMRALSEAEKSLLQIYPRVLPVSLGVAVRFHFGTREIFGFGEGWHGFGVVDSEGSNIRAKGGDLQTENENMIITGPLITGADWVAQTDVKPYTN